MKKLCERYTYPAIVVMTAGAVIIALGVIYWNKGELRAINQQKDKIVLLNRELAGIKEKINFLKQQEVIYSQKRSSAEQALKNAEEALTKLAREKAEAEGVISRAATAGNEENLAKKNLGELTIQTNLLKAQSADHAKTILTQQLELKKLQGEVDKTRKELSALQKMKLDLSTAALEYERVKQNLNTASSQYASTRKDDEKLRKQLSATEEKVKVFQRQAELAQLKLQNLEQSAKEKENVIKEIASLKEQYAALQKKFDNLKQNKFDLLSAKNEYEKVKKNIQKRIAEHKEYVTQTSLLKGEQKELTKQRQNLLTSIGQLNASIKSLQKRENELRKENTALNSKNAALTQNSQSQLSAMTANIKRLSDEVAKLQAEKHTLSANISDSQKKLVLLKKDAFEQEKLVAARREYEQLKKVLSNLNAEEKSLREKLASHKGELQALAKQKQPLLEALAQLKTNIASSQKMEQALKEKNTELASKNAVLQENEKKRLSALNIAVKNTSEELARLQAEKQLLDKKLVGMRKDNFVQQQQETAFKKMQNDLSLLQSQYSLIRKKLQNVKEELKIQENLFSEQEKAYSKRRIKMETEIRRLQMHKERISRNNGGK